MTTDEARGLSCHLNLKKFLTFDITLPVQKKFPQVILFVLIQMKSSKALRKSIAFSTSFELEDSHQRGG